MIFDFFFIQSMLILNLLCIKKNNYLFFKYNMMFKKSSKQKYIIYNTMLKNKLNFLNLKTN